MSSYVPGIGNPSAKLAVVGEAPGEQEEALGYPFAGFTGKIVDNLLESNGVPRSEAYLTNVVKVRPPNNDLNLLPEGTIEKYIPQLWEEIDAIKPNCILGFGALALKALTGYSGILKYRGSILRDNHFGRYKVVSTIHPAALFKNKYGEEGEGMMSWKQMSWINFDVKRAIEQSVFSDFRIPQRSLQICRSSLDLWRFLDRHSKDPVVSIDIETYRTMPLCLGIAFDRYEALSIPFFNTIGVHNFEGISHHDMAEIWKTAADFLADPSILKSGQNLKFDGRRLDVSLGMPINFVWFDTMFAFRTLYPELPAALQFSTSVLTDEPYYKDEGKEFNIAKDRLDKLLLYNGRDSVVEHEIMEVELKELDELGLTEFFFKRVMPLHNLYYTVDSTGMRTDAGAKRRLSIKYDNQLRAKQEELDSILDRMYGRGIIRCNPNSPIQVAQLLFKTFRLPFRKTTNEKTLLALKNNTCKDAEQRRCIQLILDIRKVRKTKSTYVEAKLSADHRMHTIYNAVGTETGRTSTSKLGPPVSVGIEGVPFQQITKYGEIGVDVREMYVVDEGRVILEWDQSQAEARVVATLAKDWKMLKCFDYKIDIHRYTAAGIKDCQPRDLLARFFIEKEEEKCWLLARELNKILKELVTPQERQDIGKKPRHAGNYGMKKRRAAELMECSEWRAGKVLDKFHQDNPNISNVFWAEIRQALIDNNNVLTTPFGRRRQFFERHGDELWKEAYAYIPQSVVSDLTKFALVQIMKRVPIGTLLYMEGHDSALMGVRPRDLLTVARIIKEEVEQPIDFSKCSLPRGELIIPVEFKYGYHNWREMYDWDGKTLPYIPRGIEEPHALEIYRAA